MTEWLLSHSHCCCNANIIWAFLREVVDVARGYDECTASAIAHLSSCSIGFVGGLIKVAIALLGTIAGSNPMVDMMSLPVMTNMVNWTRKNEG